MWLFGFGSALRGFPSYRLGDVERPTWGNAHNQKNWGAVLCSMSRPTPHTSRNVFVNGIPYLCSVCRLRCIPCLSCFHATNKLVGCTQSTWQLNACCPGGVFCWIPSFEFPVERIRAPIKRALPNYGQEPVAIAMNDTLPLEMHVCWMLGSILSCNENPVKQPWLMHPNQQQIWKVKLGQTASRFGMYGVPPPKGTGKGVPRPPPPGKGSKGSYKDAWGKGKEKGDKGKSTSRGTSPGALQLHTRWKLMRRNCWFTMSQQSIAIPWAGKAPPTKTAKAAAPACRGAKVTTSNKLDFKDMYALPIYNKQDLLFNLDRRQFNNKVVCQMPNDDLTAPGLK